MEDKELERGVQFLVWDGIASWVMATLTGNPFLVSLILLMGASNFVVGLVAAIPPVLQLLQIPAIYVVEHFRRRRRICVSMAAISRSMLLLVAAAPFLGSQKAGLALVVVGIALQASFAAISVCSWNSWMRDFLPESRMGDIYARRLSWAFLMSTILNVTAGLALDRHKKIFPGQEADGLALLFLAGWLSGIVGLFFLSRIPEPKMGPRQGKLDLTRLIREPFRDLNFRNLIVFLGSWNFAVNLAAPFFTVYLLKTLKFSMSFVIGFMVLSQIANFASLRLWGRFSDRYSNKTVMSVAGPLFVFSILAWTSVKLSQSREVAVLVLMFLHIAMGVATAGITISAQNMALKLAPRDRATGYLAAVSMINSLASGLAPILGGLFADYFAKRELTWSFQWKAPDETLTLRFLDFSGWDFFFAIAFLVGMYSLHRLALVKEVGEVKEKVLVDEIIFMARREARNISNIAGIRFMTQIPIGLSRYLTKRTFKRDGRSKRESEHPVKPHE